MKSAEDEERVSKLVLDAAVEGIAKIGRDLKWCWNKRVGDINNPILIACADSLFQVRFSNCLLDTA